MNNNQGHFIQNNAQPFAGWPQGAQQTNQSQQPADSNRMAQHNLHLLFSQQQQYHRPIASAAQAVNGDSFTFPSNLMLPNAALRPATPTVPSSISILPAMRVSHTPATPTNRSPVANASTALNPAAVAAVSTPPTPQSSIASQELYNKQHQALLSMLYQHRSQQQQQQQQQQHQQQHQQQQQQQQQQAYSQGGSPQLPSTPRHTPQHTPTQTPQPQAKVADAAISDRNNIRLAQLEKEIASATMFGPACDEFLEWLQDVRAYNTANEAALMRCAATVRQKFEYGRWSSMRIFDTIYSYISYLSKPAQNKIVQWRDEIRGGAVGESSSSSRSQTSSPVASSLASLTLRQDGARAVRPQPATHFQPPIPASHPQPAYPPPAAAAPPPVLQQPSWDTVPWPCTHPLPGLNPAHPAPPAKNPLSFIRKVGYAISPFRLQHKKTVSKTPFFINPECYARLWKGPRQGLVDPTHLPLSYVLTAWRDTASENKCEWPEQIRIEINRVAPNLAKRRKTHVQGRPDNVYSYQGKDKPLDAGMYLVQGANELVIEQIDCACSYWFAVQIFLRETEEIITAAVQKRCSDVSKGRATVDRLLGKTSGGDDDIEISQANVKIGLKCPISLQRIKVPVKGDTCRHADCFDLASYLAVNHENPSWKCPHCNEYTPPDRLYRDGFYLDVMGRVGREAVEVEFTEDSEHFRVIKSETPDDEDAADDDKKEETIVEESKSENVVISLLSDDDDDDDDDDDEGEASSRKRAAETDESTTAVSETSTERSPETPNTISKRSRREYPSQFAPMDSAELLSSFMALAASNSPNEPS